ncbi:MARVEL domain-containing protein 3 [Denticeps clupeoides]|uniref:MARVEL domain-containing protein 3 n=1 Tax=Denticeps clupeoides TaxID=299321 RepID=UPI0010A4A1B6|nr:MARVEL domain-containing protein 3-like [Denticeps clupeoides]XP_028812761.1 MARVEL domain-containing protein 3-like [Denticeps clupeoides]
MPEANRYSRREREREPYDRERSSYDRQAERDTQDYYKRDRHRGECYPEQDYTDRRHNQDKSHDVYHQSRHKEHAESPESFHICEPQEEALYNLRYLGTGRGMCQIMEVLLNMLIIICAGVPYSSSGQYLDLASLGGLYQYYYGGAQAFTGAEAERVKELDRLFYQLRRPSYVFSMACGGALMSYACAMLALGIFRVPFRWPVVLIVEAILNCLIALGYIPAVAFFFIKINESYSSSVCKDREEMYKSKGHQGFGCTLSGTDIAGGLFGVLGTILFSFCAVLTIRAFRKVQGRKWRETEANNL